MKKNNILVILPTKRDLRELEIVNKEYGYNLIFYGKNPRNSLQDFNITYFIKDILSFIKNKNINAIIGTHDYPAALTAAMISKKLNLPSPDIESILLCQHKYCCRQYQKKYVPEAYVESKIISPYKNEKLPFDFPFFIKPVRSFLSIMAAKIESFQQYNDYLIRARTHLNVFNAPFNLILKEYPEIQYSADNFIAEKYITGRQVTLEVYSFKGELNTIGIVDSKMYPNRISFKSFDYPAVIKKSIREKMENVSRKITRAINFDNGILNIEFFLNLRNGVVKIIEINPRMCSQFADMMEKVNGINTYAIQLLLALGDNPKKIQKDKKFKYASSFVLRKFKDRKILSLPNKKNIETVLKKYPDARIEIFGKEGDMLSAELNDLSSYRYGLINIGEDSKKELHEKYNQIYKSLEFKFED